MTGACDLGAELALAAESLIGSPFRLHGRNPQTGIDCVGLLAKSLEKVGRKPEMPRGYSLRNVCIEQWLSLAEANGFTPCSGSPRPGDLLMSRPGPGQYHLMIAAGGSHIIHAHAGLRRVVIQPLARSAKLVAHWRLIPID